MDSDMSNQYGTLTERINQASDTAARAAIARVNAADAASMRTYDVLADVYPRGGQRNAVTERVRALTECAARAECIRRYGGAAAVDVLVVIPVYQADQADTGRGGLLARLALSAAGY